MLDYLFDEVNEFTRLYAGDRVRLRGGWVATITQDGLDCDCGKGVLCPLNPQHPVDSNAARTTLTMVSR